MSELTEEEVSAGVNFWATAVDRSDIGLSFIVRDYGHKFVFCVWSVSPDAESSPSCTISKETAHRLRDRLNEYLA